MLEIKVQRKRAGTIPFRYSRPVRFGDTDAAGIVYTGRVSDMALEALEAWFDERLHLNWFETLSSSPVDTACVHLEIDFCSPMTPRDTLDIVVLLERASGSSFQVRLLARTKGEGALRWQSRCVFACVDVKTFRPKQIPRSWQKFLKPEVALTIGVDATDCWKERPHNSNSALRGRVK